MEAKKSVTICPNCGYANSGKDVCENCFYSFSPRSDKIIVKHRMNWSFMAVAILCISISFSGWIAFGGANPNAVNEIVPVETDSSWRTEDHSQRAYAMFCDFVKDRCPTPGTAVFPAFEDADVTVERSEGGIYQIRSWVECDSSGGIRSRAYFSGSVDEEYFAQWKIATLSLGNFEPVR